MAKSLPPWLSDYAYYHCNDVLANLGKEQNRARLLEHSRSARAALEYGLGQSLYDLLDNTGISLKGMLRLVATGATTEASFIDAVFENPKFSDLEQLARDRPLRLRHVLYKAGELLHGSPHVDEFLRSFPSPQHVRNARAGDLFPAAHRLSPAAAKAIVKLYAEGNVLREKVIKNLVTDGKVADFIEQNEALTDVSIAVEEAQAAGVDSRAVRRFYQNENAARELDRASSDGDGPGLYSKRSREARIEELETLQTKLAEEEEFVASRNKEGQEAALKRLQELKKVVQPHENWDRSVDDTPVALFNELQASVEQSLSALRRGNYDRVEQVASLASGGLLRKGMMLLPSRSEYRRRGSGKGANEVDCRRGIGTFKPALLSAFSEPHYLTKYSASTQTPTTEKVVSTASLTSFDGFQNSIQTHGLDYAATAHFGGYSGMGAAAGRASGERHKRKEKGIQEVDRSELKVACVAMCDELPMCSFEPATAAMTFTDDAVMALATIGRNHVKALQFMEKYGELVPMGTHTLGGVRIFKMALEKTSTEGSALTWDVVEKEWNTSIALGGFSVFGGGTGAAATQGREETAIDKGTAHKTQAYHSTVNTVLIGPQAINRGTFWDALASSNKTWRVIGRDLSFSTLVPIWEVIEHSRGGKRLQDPVEVAQVLRSAWCKRAIQVIDDGDPLLLEEHKDLVMQLFNTEANSPLAPPAACEGNGAGTSHDMDWVSAALQAVEVEIIAARSATGGDAQSVRRSALVEAFRIVRIRAPKEWQSASQLRYFPFRARAFCEFVEMLLTSPSSDGELVLRARLHGREMTQDIMRLIRSHSGGTDAAVRNCYPYLTSFLDRVSTDKKEDVDEFSTVGVLGADFPDAVSLDEACKWLQRLSNLNDGISDSSRSRAACQVLHAALVALENDLVNLVVEEHRVRMHAHLDHFNRICRYYDFIRDHFRADKEPGANDLYRMADELRVSLLREFKVGAVVKKTFPAPRWEGSVGSKATLYGLVVGLDTAQTAHVRVEWLRLKGVDVFVFNREEAKRILVKRCKEHEEENSNADDEDLNAFVTYEHVSDLEQAHQLPSPSSQPRNRNDEVCLGMALTPQSESLFSRLRLCADRSSEKTPSMPLRYVDKLRWRQPDVDKNPSRRTWRSRFRSATTGGRGSGASANSSISEASRSFGSGAVPVMDVYKDLENAEEVDQVLICAALLDQRKAVPLFWKRETTAHTCSAIAKNVASNGEQQARGDTCAVDIFPVLAFLRARLEIPERVVDLHTDEKLPGVVFYEPHPHSRPSAAQKANDILHTHFRRNAPTDLVVSLEMSVGFMDQREGGKAWLAPCLVFLVRGDAHLLPAYLTDAFEAGVLVVSSCSAALSLEKLPNFFTRSDSAYCFSLEPSAEMPDNWYGPMENVDYETLRDDLKEFMNYVLGTWWDENCNWRSMRSLFSSLRVSGKEAPPVTRTTLFACATEDPFHNLKIPDRDVRSQMELQDLFREEARLEDGQSHRNRNRLHDIRTRCRPNAAARVLKNPIMVAFMETLQAPTRTHRLLRLQRLDEALAEASLRNPRVLRAQEQIDHIDKKTRRFTTSEAELNRLKHERQKLVSERYNNRIDLACLSRELGHLYSALFETHRREDVDYLPDLAAQLLLDGGTIEFMDGDAAKVNEFWVASVITALNLKLKAMYGGRDIRVSVRSAFGVQSCGKSTVLNCMYGCQLPTSAGMCTRGINMFIVPCERSGSPYQAILGLDTEGICSPEQERQDASETALINNRMALFCVLLADAALCISITESNDIFRETLSIVMAVYHGSDMAVHQGNMRSRLFFLYNRSSSVNEVNGVRMKFEQDRVFLDVLRGAWKQASNWLGGTKGESKIVPPAFLTLLDLDKDIERVQHLNQGVCAPDDVPVPSFGRKLAKFNDHIHNSITHGLGRHSNCGTSLWEFIQRIKGVNEAVYWGKNYLLYPDIMWYKQRVREDTAFEASLHEAAKLSYDAFRALQSEMVSEYENGNDEGHDTTTAGAGIMGSAAAKDWESTPWPSRIRQMVYNVFSAKLDDMRQALQTLMGDSFEAKISEYERHWNEKAKVDGNAKQRALRMKWTVMNGIAPRLKAVQKKIYRKLFQEATNERKRTSSSKISDEDACKMFKKVFDEEVGKARDEDPNIEVKNRLFSIAVNDLQPHLAFGTGDRSQQWYEDNVIYASHPRRAQDYGRRGYSSLWPWRRDRSSEMTEYVNSIFEEAERRAKDKCDEFSNHVAYELLSYVEERIDHWNRKHERCRFSDPQRTDIHMDAIARIGDILQRKQDHYHNRHSLEARIMKERENIFSYFKITLKGKKGRDALAAMLRHELWRCVRASRTTFALTRARLLLDSEPWLRSAEGSLALVDYEILQQYKKGNKIGALCLASDADSFNEIIAEHIVLSLDAEKLHQDIVLALQNSLRLAKDKCVQPEGDVSPWWAALDELKERATAKHLTINLSASVDIVHRSPPVTEDLDQTAENFFKELVDWLNHAPVDRSPFDGKELYESMGEDMPTEGALQARCGAGCPRCAMPCMKERGHNTRYTGESKLHSCTHQPRGLAGGSWERRNHLCWESCVHHVKAGNLMRRKDDTISYREFRKWYPEWEQPPETQRARPVREFLFYNCQPELVEMYPGKKECSDLNKSNFSRHRLEDLLKSSSSVAFGKVM